MIGMAENKRASSDESAVENAVGRIQEAIATITPDLVRHFNAVFDLDERYSNEGDVAPLGIHFCLAPTLVPTAALREDGHPAKSDFLPAPFPRRMWAGGELTLATPLRIGDVVKRRSQILDVTMKVGRSGNLCFVTVEHVLSVGGEVAIRERQDIVYREFEAAPAAAKPFAAADNGDERREICPSAVLLFRYSALTLNAHRIHYDRNYSIEVEHYPALVVHGPLQATLLLQFAAAGSRGQPPRVFSFRSAAPLFDDRPFFLNARRSGRSAELWTSITEGPAAMTAQALW